MSKDLLQYCPTVENFLDPIMETVKLSGKSLSTILQGLGDEYTGTLGVPNGYRNYNYTHGGTTYYYLYMCGNKDTNATQVGLSLVVQNLGGSSGIQRYLFAPTYYMGSSPGMANPEHFITVLVGTSNYNGAYPICYIELPHLALRGTSSTADYILGTTEMTCYYTNTYLIIWKWKTDGSMDYLEPKYILTFNQNEVCTDCKLIESKIA